MASSAKSAQQFDVQHVARVPRGWRVRTKRMKSHELRFAFPPGRRKTGSGKLVEVLHPSGENPGCEIRRSARTNPETLLIFGNPANATDLVDQLLDSYSTWRRGGLSKEEAIRRTLAGSLATAGEREEFKAAVEAQSNSSRVNPRRTRRRNQEDGVSESGQAVRLFEIFHGRAPEEILDEQRSSAMRLDYTALGDLRAIGIGECPYGDDELVGKWEECQHIWFEGDDVKLAISPNGRQLYFIGGNQDLSEDLGDFEGVDATKDLVDLGEVSFVVYDARKIHSNFVPIEWVHKFGGVDDQQHYGPPVLPRLLFDRLKRELFLAGGEYFVDDTTKVSPGIEN